MTCAIQPWQIAGDNGVEIGVPFENEGRPRSGQDTDMGFGIGLAKRVNGRCGEEHVAQVVGAEDEDFLIVHGLR